MSSILASLPIHLMSLSSIRSSMGRIFKDTDLKYSFLIVPSFTWFMLIPRTERVVVW